MGFWLELGVAGFRIDAAPFLIGMAGMDGRPHPEDPHVYLRQMRDFIQLRKGDSIFLGEVDVGLSTIADYLGAATSFTCSSTSFRTAFCSSHWLMRQRILSSLD